MILDREQINRATIGAGTIIVDGKEANPSINRDESKSQELTKDISVEKITFNYDENRRKWNEIPIIMGEYGLALGKDLDTAIGKVSEKDYKLEEKLGQEFYNGYKGVENFIDYKLGNKHIGIIPTEDTNGGITGQLQNPKLFFGYGAESIRLKYRGIVNGNNLTINSTMEELTDEAYKEVKKNNPNALVYMNGVGNTKRDFIEGLAAGTFTADEIKILENGGTVERIGIFNPTNGLIADVAEAGIGLLGNKIGLNWAGNDVKEIFIKRPDLMKNFIAHSQGTIKYKAAIDSLYKTEEGKLLLKDNIKNTLLVGLAITPGMYKDLEGKFEEISKMKGEDNKIKLEKLVNRKDIVPGMWGHKPNTDFEKHPVKNYNLKDFIFDETLKVYERKVTSENQPIENIELNIKDYHNLDIEKRFNINRGDSK